MTAQEHILARLNSLKEPVVFTEEPKGTPEEIIYAKLMSKKFRKVKAGAPCVEITKRVVAKAVKEQKPILVTECFGGNKLWRFEEAPGIEWAELFSLIYFMEWLKTVAAVHKPGIIFDYFSQDIAVQKLDNISKEELDSYNNGFKEMIEWFKPYIPDGITIQYRRLRDMYESQEAYDKEMAEAQEKYLAENNNELPVLDESLRTKTELNVRLSDGQDKDPQWREKVELQHKAIFMLPTHNEYLLFPDMVWTCAGYYDDSIVTGSTKKSYAKFWAGVGAFEPKEDGSFYEIVLTPKQLAAAEFEWEEVNIEGLNGKNFKKVRILK
jgi:hypothetical protein